MSAFENVLAKLAAQGGPVRRVREGQAQVCCPAHEDREPSLSVGTGDDGRVLLLCHRGCSPEDIMGAAALDWPDLFDGPPPKPYTLAGLRRAGASIEHDGRLRLGGVRYLPGASAGQVKTLADRGSQRGPVPDPATVRGPELWVVEGEGDLLSAATIELPAIALPGTAKWRPEWPRQIAARRERVIIVCDSDQAGREAAGRWAAAIAEHCPDVRVLDLYPDLDDGSDLSTFLADAVTEDERRGAPGLLRDLADRARRVKAGTSVVNQTQPATDTAGEDEDWLSGTPMDPLATPPEPLAPTPGFPYAHQGAGVIVVGPTGGGRSSLVQAGAYDAARAGLRVGYLGVEVTEREFNARAADLAARRGDPVDDELRAALARVRYLDLPTVISRAWNAPDAWVRQAVARYDIVLCDPLSSVASALDLDFDQRNTQYVAFHDRIVQPLINAGLLVVVLDNVGHDADAKNRAKGASAKRDRADVEISCRLRSHPPALILTARKVRSVRTPFHRDDTWIFDRATQRVTADHHGTEEPAVVAPFRPTVLMERLSRAIEATPGLSKSALRRAVPGNNEAKDRGLDLLIAEEFVRVESVGQASQHHSQRPFREAGDHNRAPLPEPCPNPAQGRGAGNRAPVPLPIGGTGHGARSNSTADDHDRAPLDEEVAA